MYQDLSNFKRKPSAHNVNVFFTGLFSKVQFFPSGMFLQIQHINYPDHNY